MTTRLYTNYGTGGTDGAVATNLLLAAGGNNPLLVGGGAGWTFEADDLSPDGPTGALGFRRTADGVSSYLRSEFVPTGTRSGGAFWFYLSAAPAADQNFMRLVNASEQAIINLTRRTTGTVWLSLVSTVNTASQSPVLGVGWYRFELLADHVASRAWYRILDSAGATVFSWDSGQGAANAGRGAVTGVRFGEPASSAHGITTIRIGSRPVWGSLDLGWFPRTVAPWVAPLTPPPPTTAVSHYNTAEGLSSGSVVTAGVGLGTDGIKFSARGGDTGTIVSVTSDAIKGSRAYLVEAGNSQAYLQWGLRSRSLATRMHIQVPRIPTFTTRVMIHRNSADEPVAGMLLTSSGQVMVQVGRGSTVVTRSMGGVVDTSMPLRLQMWTDVDNGVFNAAWGYADHGDEATVNIPIDLGGIELTLAQFGKLLSSNWADAFVIDDLAANVRAKGFIGGYAATYTLLPTLMPDQTGVEPGELVTLEALSGTGTWTQVAGPTVALTLNGATATFEAPFTRFGANLVFDYGSSELKVDVLRATERAVLPFGVEVGARLESVQ